ncbi:MAG: cytochrome c3 family protein, partial [Pseudomonadota bacterium]
MRHHALLPGCLVVLLLLLCAQEISAADEPRGVAKTKHNLTASGPGSIKSSDDKFVCGICHIPHMGNTASPAWSRNKRMVYKTYKSPTAKASIGQPTGASRLCLTCHDGTVAISNPSSSAGALRKKSSLGKIPSGKSNLGTDLSDDHPVSFVYDNALAAKRGELAMPTILQDKVRLDETGQLQCTSCHDAHHDQFGKFLMMENKASALCLTCHTIKG